MDSIPGIGRTFIKDFARIGVTRVAQLRSKKAETLFEKLIAANAAVGHPTSKNYLYVIRMAVYYADGGRDPEKLRWNAWIDAKVGAARATVKKTSKRATAPRASEATGRRRRS